MLPVTPAPDAARRGHISDVSTDMIKVYKNNNKWVWSALVLNLLLCLAVAAEYAWQVGNATVAANTLLDVLPAVLIGPLLALPFRRVSYRAPLWGLFWGVFFGLTDALVSILLCFIWVALIQLPTNFHCKPWCAPGEWLQGHVPDNIRSRYSCHRAGGSQPLDRRDWRRDHWGDAYALSMSFISIL